MHTPGPWTAIWKGEYVVPEEHAGRHVGGSIYPDQDRDGYAQIIAHIKSDKYGRGSREANARLIAAAPDLLAVLDSLDDWMDRLHAVRGRWEAPGMEARSREVKAAIAGARPDGVAAAVEPEAAPC